MKYSMTERHIIVGFNLNSPAEYNVFTFAVTCVNQRSVLDKQDAAFLYNSCFRRILQYEVPGNR